jgi:hypothetical protein
MQRTPIDDRRTLTIALLILCARAGAATAQPEATAPAATAVAAPALATPANLAGQVRLAGSNAPLEGAMVLLDGDRAATTDAEGRFVLRGLTAGEHLISLVGPQGQDVHTQLTLPPGSSLERTFTLRAREVEQVTVVQKVERPRPEAGEVDLSQREVSEVAGTFGDPARVIENLPGASRAPGGAGGALIIRGASPQDSAVLIDGIQIPLLYHFGGLTSVINSEFLSAVSFLPGGFGPQYGRATAGVVQIESAALSCDGLRASASVDPLDAELFACAPVGRWRVAAAARRSYLDAFLPAILRASAKDGESPTIVTPAYFDYQVKAERTWDGQRLELFAFGARDAFKLSRASSEEDADMSLGGSVTYHRFQIRHLAFGERLRLESAVVPGFLRGTQEDGSQDLSTRHHAEGNVYTVQWRETATLRLDHWLTARGGIDHLLTHFDFQSLDQIRNLARRYPTPLETDASNQSDWHQSSTSVDQAYWAELVLNATDHLTVTPGLRVANLALARTRRFVLEPRVAARWQATTRTAFTAAGGVYRKLPDLFSGLLVDGFGQPKLDAERAVHMVTGVERQLGPFETKLEGFYVRRDRLPSPTDEVEIGGGKAQPVLFRSDGSGRSYGLEVMVRLPADERRRFSGWVAYTLSRSYRSDRMGFASGGSEFMSYDPTTPRRGNLSEQTHEYLSPYDQTHILTTVGRWELPWNSSLGFRFQLVTGNPTTPLQRGETYYDADSDRYQVRPGSVASGSERLPTFHRLDLRFDKHWQFAHWRLTAYLELVNAYNRRPVESIGYDYRYRTRTELKGLPILPLLGIKGAL